MSETQIHSDADFPDPYTIPLADINVVNQHGVLVTVARHILRWVKNTSLPED